MTLRMAFHLSPTYLIGLTQLLRDVQINNIASCGLFFTMVGVVLLKSGYIRLFASPIHCCIGWDEVLERGS